MTFVLVRGTLMPGLGYWDTGEAQTVPPVLGTFHPTGFPTYALVGWLASIVLQPFGDAAFRMNLLNALLASGSAALTVVLVHQLTGRTILALAARDRPRRRSRSSGASRRTPTRTCCTCS